MFIFIYFALFMFYLITNEPIRPLNLTVNTIAQSCRTFQNTRIQREPGCQVSWLITTLLHECVFVGVWVWVCVRFLPE